MSKFAPHRRSNNHPKASSATICQKCLGTGHFIFECKSTRPYVSRPSRTELLENPRLLAKLKAEGKPSVEVPEEFRRKSGTANRILEAKELERQEPERSKGKAKEEDEPERTRKKARRSSRSSSSDSSDSESDSGSSSSDSSESSSRASRSVSRERSRKRPRRRRSSSIISESSSRSGRSRA